MCCVLSAVSLSPESTDEGERKAAKTVLNILAWLVQLR